MPDEGDAMALYGVPTLELGALGKDIFVRRRDCHLRNFLLSSAAIAAFTKGAAGCQFFALLSVG